MSNEESRQPTSQSNHAEHSTLSRFDIMPDGGAVNVDRFSVFRRVRQVFRRSDSQSKDADSFFGDKLDLYLD